MNRVLSVLGLALALLLPAAATGGGFATVQLSSTPTGLAAGETWGVDLTVLQHGMTPLDDIRPEIHVWTTDTPTVFRATPAGEPGVYHADVVFPAEGTWRWEIWDGFSQTHTFTPAQIGPAGGDGGSGPSWSMPVLGVLGAAVALALVVLGLRRRHARHIPVPGV